MYNLIVSSNPDEWGGAAFRVEQYRCVLEYTSDAIRERFGALGEPEIASLMQFPAIFAYEARNEKDPKFGLITEVTVRQNSVRLGYQIHDVRPFLTYIQLEELSFELDILKWELNRTHWAVKDIDLPRELYAHGIRLPVWAGQQRQAININTHVFDVALSFPGQARDVVEPIAIELERRLGPDRYFYDQNYVGNLARPNLDILLQDIYGRRSKLLVVFISGEYQERLWCGIEFRAIRQIINEKQFDRVMYVKTGEGNVEGVMPADGYVDDRHYSAGEIAHFIETRLAELAI